MKQLLIFVLASASLGTSYAYPQEDSAEPAERFSETAEVVVHDVLVELQGGRSKSSRRSRDLDPQDLEVLLDGDLARIVGVENRDSLKTRPEGPSGEDAWRIVLYFDRVLPSRVELRWGAGLLARHVDELTALGPVEIWLAGAEAHQVLVPTRSAADLDRMLSQLALFGEADDQLSSRRYSSLATAHETAYETGDRVSQAELLAESERAFVLGRQDLLLDILRPQGMRGPRQALFVVGANIDLMPHRYYRERLSISKDGEQRSSMLASLGDAGGESTSATSAGTESDGLDFAKTLAAIGWTVVPLVPPAPSGGNVRGGLRLGKIRLQGLMLSYEGERRPRRARAYLELGNSLMVQEEYAEAVDAYQRAVHHFYNDKKTVSEQAGAVAALARALESRGEAQAARRALEVAVDLDPSVAEEIEGGIGWFVDEPEGFATLLENATGGWVALDDFTLGEALASLAGLIRVSYQPDQEQRFGVVQQVKVLLSGAAEKVRHAAWTVRGSTERLAEARARLLLTNRQKGSFRVMLNGTPGWNSGLATVVNWRTSFPATDLLRVSWAIADSTPEPGSADLKRPLKTGHRQVNAGYTNVAIVLPVDSRSSRAVVVVEHLANGAWGAAYMAP